MFNAWIAKLIFFGLLGHFIEVKLNNETVIYQFKHNGKVITKYKIQTDKEQKTIQGIIDSYEVNK